MILSLTGHKNFSKGLLEIKKKGTKLKTKPKPEKDARQKKQDHPTRSKTTHTIVYACLGKRKTKGKEDDVDMLLYVDVECTLLFPVVVKVASPCPSKKNQQHTNNIYLARVRTNPSHLFLSLLGQGSLESDSNSNEPQRRQLFFVGVQIQTYGCETLRKKTILSQTYCTILGSSGVCKKLGQKLLKKVCSSRATF